MGNTHFPQLVFRENLGAAKAGLRQRSSQARFSRHSKNARDSRFTLAFEVLTQVVVERRDIWLLREAFPYVWFTFSLIPIGLLFIATEERRQSEAIASLVAQAARRLGFEEWRTRSNSNDERTPNAPPTG